MSELDAFHQQYILESIKDNQTFITCCELNNLNELAKRYDSEKNIYETKNGNFIRR
jgi:recombinational DNA repair ATPase RecF